MQASIEHNQWILVQIALDGIKIREKKFNWLIDVQASGKHKQRILVQDCREQHQDQGKKFNCLILCR